ncbi:MAG: GNAT family N-acetyltransferase [Spirochaetaceae bacterium]
MKEITIKPFKPEYQEECKNIILMGLEEHWGLLDLSLNSDLNDIESYYQNDIFLTGWLNNELISTGAAKLLANGTAQIVRMSVLKKYRSHGIGKKMLEALIDKIKYFGVTDIVLETTTEWKSVILFYENNGFILSHKDHENSYFKLLIN